MTRGKRILLAMGGLALLGYGLTGVRQIAPGERAVVRRFGRVLDVQPRPGLWIGLPAGMDRVDRVAVEQVRRVTIGYQPDFATSETTPPGQILTGDQNLVNVRVVVSYSVDPDAVVDFVVHQERVEEIVQRLTEAALAEWVGARRVDGVLIRGPGELPGDLKQMLDARLPGYRLGIRVRGVDVAHLAPPDEVKSAFDRVNQAEAEAETLVNQARQEAARKDSEAASEVNRMDRQTQTYILNRLREACAAATAFDTERQQLEKNPAALEARRWQHLAQVVQRLRERGAVFPIDPEINLNQDWLRGLRPEMPLPRPAGREGD